MSRRSSWVDVVEAAYRVEEGGERWLAGLLEATRPMIDDGFGVCAAIYDATDPRGLRFTQMAQLDYPEELLAMTRMVNETADADTLRRTYLSSRSGPAAAFVTKDQYEATFSAHTERFGIYDSFGLNAIDPTGFGCVIIAPQSKVVPPRPNKLALWARVAAHVAAGHRLLRAAAAPTWEAGAEAILEPDGTFQHAAGPAQDVEQQHALRSIAKAIDQARGRRASGEAIRLWIALIEGRWSLVEHFDTDGRRYFLARKNDPDARGQRALTVRERQVIAYASLGHSDKLIAYELGIARSTVANHVSEAISKLGLRSRTELIQAYATLVWDGREPQE